MKGKDADGPGTDFEFVVIITARKLSPQNFWCVQNDLLLLIVNNLNIIYGLCYIPLFRKNNQFEKTIFVQ